MKRILLLSVLIVLIATVGTAQLKQGSYGIQTGISGTVGALGVVYNLAPNMRLAANLGFTSTSPTGVSSSTEFKIGAGVAYYLGTSENISTFVGGAFGFTSATGSSGFDLNAQYGAEYWFSPRFSLIGYLQFGFSSAGPSGATTSSFGTGTGTALTFYFN